MAYSMSTVNPSHQPTKSSMYALSKVKSKFSHWISKYTYTYTHTHFQLSTMTKLECRTCLDTKGPPTHFVQPCACTSWVHFACLQKERRMCQRDYCATCRQPFHLPDHPVIKKKKPEFAIAQDYKRHCELLRQQPPRARIIEPVDHRYEGFSGVLIHLSHKKSTWPDSRQV